MTPQLFMPILTAAAALLPSLNWDQGAQIQLLATAEQESGFGERIQVPSGEARSFFQMEQQGALIAIYGNSDANALLVSVCGVLAIQPGIDTVFEAITYNDVLATCVARLNYAISPIAVPAVGDSAAALSFYCNVWRPAWFLAGQPEPGRWTNAYADAQAAVLGASNG